MPNILVLQRVNCHREKIGIVRRLARMLLAPSPVQGITRFLLVAILLVAPGCLGPIVTRAPFPQRPESVKRGSRLGPFEGRVLDADTQKPLEKTRIWCSWAFNRGIGTPAPEATRSFETVTDPDGHYLVPRLKTLPLGLSTRLAHFTLIAYRRGYVAYRHEWRFSAPGRHRRDFSQLANVIRLTRWSSELSHAKHWLYLGGPPSIRSMSPKDLLAAAADLAAASHRPRQATARAASQSPHPRPRKGLASRILLS
ncbi:MAG: hypothetical protein KAI47_15365, partial [Deltaproteobacteria bacterium]|nr:hypothetical protein [Deltaproteobacteria bacterium]